ncbi:uncharacterized protein LOC130613662 [Hydractinia symbiolongicarpus]|uniref:uncharacterized protein LOC130613662 n=1 Tax=Hydractinia symbiolongicarpus TaxID=13093 RepID=UPI00254B2478|nr:uncharacterized protein LOC130613662 [Hydractinia symbiolongicarpus]
MENSKIQSSNQHKNTQENVTVTPVVAELLNKDTVKTVRPKRIVTRCKICCKTFRNPVNLQSHLYLHQRNKNREKRRAFFCRLCKTSYRGLSSFVDHQRSHQCEKHSLTYEIVASEQGFSSQDEEQNPTEVVITTSNNNAETIQQVTQHDQPTSQESQHSTLQNDISTLSANMVTQAETLQAGIPLPASAVSLMAALCSAATHSTTPTTNNSATVSAASKSASNTDGVQIDIPSHVKAIYLNSSSPNLGDIQKQLESLNSKVDCLMKHLNIPLDSDGNPVPMATGTIEVEQNDKLSDCEDGNTTVMLENFPPSYSVVQAAKEQQQQEYYALTLSNRQAQQVFKTDTSHILNNTPDLKAFQKGKSIDLWVPSHQYLSQLTTLSEPSHVQDAEQEQVEMSSSLISSQIIDKIFVESRSRANFAKNLTFAIFSAEERRGRNCTGRVFGKAQHKGQLDPIKLQAVKEATFRKYPCVQTLVDITWRKECITAIDSGLRNENRSVKSQDALHHHHHDVVDGNISDEIITKM